MSDNRYMAEREEDKSRLRGHNSKLIDCELP